MVLIFFIFELHYIYGKEIEKSKLIKLLKQYNTIIY